MEERHSLEPYYGQRRSHDDEYSISKKHCGCLAMNLPMLQISFQGIYRLGSRKKLIENIGENIKNYLTISIRINFDMKISDKLTA